MISLSPSDLILVFITVIAAHVCISIWTNTIQPSLNSRTIKSPKKKLERSASPPFTPQITQSAPSSPVVKPLAINSTPGSSSGPPSPIREGRPAKTRVGMRMVTLNPDDNGRGFLSASTPVPRKTSNAASLGEESVVNQNFEIHYPRPSSKVKLIWESKLGTVLIVKKWRDDEISAFTSDVITWLHTDHPQLRLYLEEDAYREMPKHHDYVEKFDLSAASEIDLVICLGGDGTVLHSSALFQQSVPPVMAFGMGSMGFLTPFNHKTIKEDLRGVLRGKCSIKMRLRLHCSILRKGEVDVEQDYHALNEAVIDRGASPFLTHLQCYCDDKLITTVQADGIIIATATGSTAYSLSSGGSLVHPMLPALLFTPICPHSLSFRPVVLPSSCTLKILIPADSHCSAGVSFDGRHRYELKPGDGVLLRISEWPVTTVSKSDQIGEWFQSLAQHLNWNRRVTQKSNSKTSASSNPQSNAQTAPSKETAPSEPRVSPVITAISKSDQINLRQSM